METNENPERTRETGNHPHRRAQGDAEVGAQQSAAGPSKSQRKRESIALQDLGEALVDLPAERLEKIDMPEVLRVAVQNARHITKHEARRRQMQYIGKLMRSVDPAPIRAALDAMAGVSAAENRRLHRIERLRERLLEDEPAALAEIVANHPAAELQRLRQLCRTVRRERDENRPARAYREIFRVLKTLDEDEALHP